MCEECGWADKIDEIDDLLNNKKANFAEDFLSSVKKWVEKNEHITEKQANGIANVRRAAERSRK